MKLMPKEFKKYLLPGVFFIIGALIGFLITKSFTTSVPQEKIETKNDLLYTSQSAIIRGKITSVNGKTITVKNTRNDSAGNVLVTEKTIITQPGANTQNLDISKIELDKEVLISLEMANGQYEAVSIQYTSPTPSLPPLPKAPAKLSPKPS